MDFGQATYNYNKVTLLGPLPSAMTLIRLFFCKHTQLLEYLIIYFLLYLRIPHHEKESPVQRFSCCVCTSKVQATHNGHQILICQQTLYHNCDFIVYQYAIAMNYFFYNSYIKIPELLF